MDIFAVSIGNKLSAVFDKKALAENVVEKH